MCTQFTQCQENGIFTYCYPCNQVYVVLSPPIFQLHVNMILEMWTVVNDVTKGNLDPECHIQVSCVLNKLGILLMHIASLS